MLSIIFLIPIGQSEASTCPRSTKAAQATAPAGLPAEQPGEGTPVTPAHRIRRRTTPKVLTAEDSARAPVSADVAAADPPKSNTGGTRDLKRKKGLSKEPPVPAPANTKATAVAAETPPVDANEVAQPKQAARKSAPKKPAAVIPPAPPVAAPPVALVKLEKVKTPATPPTVRNTRNVQTAVIENMNRASTTDLQATPAATEMDDDEDYEEGEEEEELEDDDEEESEDEEQDDEDMSEPDTTSKGSTKPAKSHATPPPSGAVKPDPPKTKTPKEKTPAQRAAAARYMRFSRSLQSFLPSNCSL